MLLSLRSFDPLVRRRVFDAIHRIVHGVATTSGAPRAPEVELTGSFPAVVNDPAAVDRTRSAFTALLGADQILDSGVVTGSEDVGLLATAAEAPCVFWLLGGGNPEDFTAARGAEEILQVMGTVPSNHSPLYAPAPRPTIDIGVAALVRQPGIGYRPTRDPLVVIASTDRVRLRDLSATEVDAWLVKLSAT